MIERLVELWQRWHYRERSLPRIIVRAGLVVPGWALRLSLAILTAGCLWLAANPRWSTVFVLILAAILCLGLMIWPDYHLALVVIVVSAMMVFIGGEEIGGLSLLGLATLGYLLFRLSLAASLLKWSSRIQLKALLRAPDLLIICLTGLLQLARLLPAPDDLWPTLLGTIGVIVLALLSWLVVQAWRATN